MNPLLTPFWEGNTMLCESLLPVRAEDGSLPPMRLLYRADEILSVQSATLETTYTPGRDYALRDGCLVIPEGSAIPVMDYGDYYLKEADPGRCFAHSESGWIRFSEGACFHLHQIAVTYRHSDSWTDAVPACKQDKLPRTAALLRDGTPFRLLIFGDSISTGANASGCTGAPPFLSPWYDLLKEGLADRFSNDGITLLNTSVGGTMSCWGVETVQQNAALLHPDLCVIAFGMNDGSGRVPPETYITNIRAIMQTVKAQNPFCEFILIATTIANREVKGFLGLQESYLEPLLALEKSGVCVADMTTVHKSLLSRKAFRDMTGNNVNHPNDFLTRVYAQVMLRTLGAL